MAMNPRLLRPTQSLDADAAVYLAAVEAADGEPLEPAVRKAIDTFFRDCKADGIWDAIKASCILCGARTLSGALVPLAGTAPTNNNFVAADYARGGATPGLKGNASNKYLNSNRAGNVDPQDDAHISVYVTAVPTSGSHAGAVDTTPSLNRQMLLAVDNGQDIVAIRSSEFFAGSGGRKTGLIGAARSSSTEFLVRWNDTTPAAVASTSLTPPTRGNPVFAILIDGTVANFSYSDARLAFYSIGESLDLEALDAAVSTLITAIGAAV